MMTKNNTSAPDFYSPVITTGEYTSFPTSAVNLLVAMSEKQRGDVRKAAILTMVLIPIFLVILFTAGNPFSHNQSLAVGILISLVHIFLSVSGSFAWGALWLIGAKYRRKKQLESDIKKLADDMFSGVIGDKALFSLCYACTQPRHEESKGRTINFEDVDKGMEAFLTLFRDGSGSLHARIYTPSRIVYPSVAYTTADGKRKSLGYIPITEAANCGEDAATFNIEKLFNDWKNGTAHIGYNQVSDANLADLELPRLLPSPLCSLESDGDDKLSVYYRNVEGRHFRITVNVENFTVTDKCEIA